MRVWLVGAEGMLGHALSSVLGDRAELRSTDVDVDITNYETVARFAAEVRPDWIFNAAAYTRVDQAEQEEALALRVNGDGPGNLAAAALAVGAGLVHVSTDYVFDGTATAPYEVDAPVAPRSAYGRSKLVGEQRVLEQIGQGLRGYVVRTAWLFGEHGHNFVRTMVRLMVERPELRVVADQRGCPTYAADLALATWQLVEHGAPPGIYHFSNSGPTTWHAFAERIREGMRELGLPTATERVLPITTAEYPLPAPRPAYSVLSTDRYQRVVGVQPRPWNDALMEYLKNLKSELS